MFKNKLIKKRCFVRPTAVIWTYEGCKHGKTTKQPTNLDRCIIIWFFWPCIAFLINVRQCSLSIKRYAFSCRTWQPGLLNALFTELMCGIPGSGSVVKVMGCESRNYVIESRWNNFFLTCLLTQQTLNTVVLFPNVLLKLQPSSH